MTCRHMIVTLGHLGVALTLAACSQQYNGALGPDSAGGASADAVPSKADPTASSKSQTNPQVQFETSSDGHGSATPARGRAMPTLALYGQLPVAVPQQTSPLDGSDNLSQVTFATEGADFDPAIDPTGTYIAFSSTRHRDTSDLYIQKVGGTAVTQLTNDPGSDMMPAFSPDGKKIAFCSDRSGSWNLYIVPTSGGAAEQLTNDATQNIHPSFSPDGKQIVYCSYGAQSGQWEMIVIDVDNPATKRHIGYGLFPSWSPTQNKIVFQRARERGSRWFAVWTIDYVNGEGARPTAIAVASNAAAINPQWGPDGKQIVFSTVINPEGSASKADAKAEAVNHKPAQADIWVMGADGSARTNLTHGKFVNVQPVWARDGAIYFVSNRSKEGVENIWSVRPAPTGLIAEPTPAKGSTPTAHEKPKTPSDHGTSTVEAPTTHE